MNEPKDILSELAQQAGLHPEWFIDNPEVEEFAELLIREFADYAEYQLQIGGTNADKIKQHFGVK